MTEEELFTQKSKNSQSFLSLPSSVQIIFVDSWSTLQILANEFGYVLETDPSIFMNDQIASKNLLLDAPPAMKKIFINNLVKWISRGRCSVEDESHPPMNLQGNPLPDIPNLPDEDDELLSDRTTVDTAIEERDVNKVVYHKVIGLDSEWAVSSSFESNVADILQVIFLPFLLNILSLLMSLIV